MKIWAFDFNNAPGRVSPDYADQDAVQRVFDHNLARMASFEALGFEGIFLSEHHFLNSLSPAPNLLIAALARVTSRLKLGVMGNVLPFHQPWRLAEELAMLDYLTDGRLEIGTASGTPPEYLFVDIAQDDVRPMYAEMLQFLDTAKTERQFSHKGKYWSYDDLIVMPRLKRVGRRRDWMTIYSAGSAELAARRDAKVCTGYQSTVKAAAAFDQYREEARRLGRSVGPDDVGIRRQVLIADTDAAAEALHKETLAAAIQRHEEMFAPVAERMQRTLGMAMPEGVRQSGVLDASAPKPLPDQAAPGGPPKMKSPNPLTSKFVSMEDEFIVGSPRTVAARILDQCGTMGAGNLLAYHPMGLEEAELDRHYALWSDVLARLAPAAPVRLAS